MFISEIFLLISSANPQSPPDNDFLQYSLQGDPLWPLHDGPNVWSDDGANPADDPDGEDDGLDDDVGHAGAGRLQAQCSVSSPLCRQDPVPCRGGDPDQEDGGEASLLDRQDEQGWPPPAHSPAGESHQQHGGELEELAPPEREVAASDTKPECQDRWEEEEVGVRVGQAEGQEDDEGQISGDVLLQQHSTTSGGQEEVRQEPEEQQVPAGQAEEDTGDRQKLGGKQ